jgi:signal transduction histidine kinase
MTAITNLLDNSLYWLAAKQVVGPHIAVEVLRTAEEVQIVFSDTGPGIPEEFQDRVFDVGFSLKPGGTGLGLSIAREAIHRSGGDIVLRQPAALGASFLITVPFTTAGSGQS